VKRRWRTRLEAAGKGTRLSFKGDGGVVCDACLSKEGHFFNKKNWRGGVLIAWGWMDATLLTYLMGKR
jgi:hypothetical protein